MTKKEYMKKLAYQLRRLPKEDFDKAMDYFEEYFEDAGIENEQKAIEDLGAPEEAASALILDLAQENAVKPPKTMKRRFSALWIAILALFAAPIALPLALCILAVLASLILGILAVVGGILVTALAAVAGSVLGIIGGIAIIPQTLGGRTGYDRSVSDADRLWNPGHIFHHITGSLDHHQTCRTARQTCEKRRKKT